MSTPARRRSTRRSTRRSNGRAELAAAALLAAVIVLALDPRIITWALITTAAATAAYLLGRLHATPPARKPVSGFRQAKRAAAQAARNDKPITAKADSQGRRNGWLPPANTQLTTLAVSPQCAAADCVACPGGGCQCTCEHDPAVIVARNQRAYDAAHPDDAPPF